MHNMTYCQFENTLSVLLELKERLECDVNAWIEMSETERISARRLIELMGECYECFPDWLGMPEED